MKCLANYFFFSFLTFFAMISFSQDFEWAIVSGASGYDQGRSVKVDAAGNVYSTGYFNGTVDFDPGPGTVNLTSSGGESCFIQKLNSNGDLIWAKSFGQAHGNSIAIDVSGNVYTTGIFQGAVDFDPGAATTVLTSNGAADIFIHKLDANGDFIWVKSMGGTNQDTGHSITVDVAGNIYTTGDFYGLIDFDPGAGITNLNTNGYDDIFIQKLDANGNFIWAKSMGGSALDRGHSITVDASGNVYTTGFFGAIVDFDPGIGTATITGHPTDDIFIQKLDANGDFVWVKAMGGSGISRGESISLDTNGNIYLTGSYSGTVDFNPGAGITNLTSAGSHDIFVQKLDVAGNFVWAKSVGGPNADQGYSISSDVNGNIYTTGRFNGPIDFDPGAGNVTLSSNGSDVFIQKLNTNGDFIWARSIGGAGLDYGFSIDVSSTGNIYTTGFFEASVDFDPNAGVSIISSNGLRDAFIQKLSQCLTSSATDVQIACDSYTWIDGNTYMTSNTSATHTLINTAGCDSIVTLNLSITNSNTGTDIQNQCGPFIWIDGNTYTSNNNTATYTLTNATGCDSVVTLDLTINSVDNSVLTNSDSITANVAGALYQWLDCDNSFSPISGETGQTFIASSNGNYAVEITDNGCVDTSACSLIEGLGILNKDIQPVINLYPNPFENALTIDFGTVQKGFIIEIKTIAGQTLETINCSKIEKLTIDINQPAGIYFIQINFDDEHSSMFRVIKQ